MADDKTLRSHRSNDPYRQAAHGAAPDSDPLAELARLIGQPDPFSDEGRGHQQHTPHHPSHYGEEAPADDWRRHVQRPQFDSVDEPEYADTRYHAQDTYDDARYAAADDGYRMAVPQGDYADAYRLGGHRREPAVGAAYADDPSYAAAPRYSDARAQDNRLRDTHSGDTRSRAAAHSNADYDDPPRRARGSGLVTAVVLIGCAMLGTAGAYGYRTYSGAAGSATAPVITADTSPSKIVPNAEQKSGRSQDRIGAGNSERLVSREEQPVALPGTQSVPRVVFPSLVQPNQAPSTTGTTASSANAQAPINQPPAGSAEPKRIRTVTIRPDSDGSQSADPPSRAAPPAGRPQPNARTTAPSAPSPPPAARGSRDEPLSLNPAATAPANPVNDARVPQQRALTPPAPRETAASPAPRVAAAPATGGGNGGYLVQVSSQRSEADAQSSYRGLQAKYSQLKSRQAIIRRADLGAKGVYYRAMVGPFDSSGEADQFCSGLKQAGGQCIILRN